MANIDSVPVGVTSFEPRRFVTHSYILWDLPKRFAYGWNLLVDECILEGLERYDNVSDDDKVVSDYSEHTANVFKLPTEAFSTRSEHVSDDELVCR